MALPPSEAGAVQETVALAAPAVAATAVGAPGTVISTYCSDSVVRVPRRSGRNDEIVLRDIGRAVARIAIDEDHGAGCDRLGRVAQQIAALSEPSSIATAAE